MEFNIESEFAVLNTALQEGGITRGEALAKQMALVDHVILLARRGMLGGEIPEPEEVRYKISDEEVCPGRVPGKGRVRMSSAQTLYPCDETTEL